MSRYLLWMTEAGRERKPVSQPSRSRTRMLVFSGREREGSFIGGKVEAGARSPRPWWADLR